MSTIYYITRTYLPEKIGGSLMRAAAVKYLKKSGFNVKVITISYYNKNINDSNILYIPFTRYKKIKELYRLFERYGFIEDYLSPWVKKAYHQLKRQVTKNDILFCTSGGDLGPIILGHLLKIQTQCRFIINLRDPIDYSLVNGLKLDQKFHVSREKQERKYIRNVDLIITSSKTNQMSLINKYPDLRDKIVNNYFGYIKKIELRKKKNNNELKIAYAGNFKRLQSPEILLNITRNIKDIELYFIGDYQKNKQFIDCPDYVHLVNFLPHDDFLNFMQENIDIAFVSLTNDYLGACIPSKIYEYINLGLPILAALPDGDAKDIINSNGYGIACHYNDISGLKEAIKLMTNNEILINFKKNILRDRDTWAMEEKIKEVIYWIKNL